jgi:hypothetical protein
MARSLRYRRFHETPLFQTFYNHSFDKLRTGSEDFQEEYSRIYESQFGFYRPIWDRTVGRFLACGDPREGLARFDCERCQDSLYVPFSCKTRLFCPTCHQKKLELWVSNMMSDVVRKDLPHRFWTFSIPKRLRIYFKYRRKLMGLLVKAAKQTVSDVLTQGSSHSHENAGMIILIQTQGDALNFNCHLHALITDGLLDYRDPKDVIYHPCLHWDFSKMNEIFRRHLFRLMIKHDVIGTEIADNMMSWPHSGFHVHASEPFIDEERLERCLRYAFRSPVTLDSLDYDKEKGRLQLTTKKKKVLEFTAKDFIAHLVQHIPDRYQNMRRYAGFYAANVRLKIARANSEDITEGVGLPLELGTGIKLSWSKLINKIFGEEPTACPRCGEDMKLVGFVMETRVLLRKMWGLSRAPPKLTIERRNNTQQLSVATDEMESQQLEFDQSFPAKEGDFDQTVI